MRMTRNQIAILSAAGLLTACASVDVDKSAETFDEDAEIAARIAVHVSQPRYAHDVPASQLSRVEARRIALGAQGFGRPPPRKVPTPPTTVPHASARKRLRA